MADENLNKEFLRNSHDFLYTYTINLKLVSLDSYFHAKLDSRFENIKNALNFCKTEFSCFHRLYTEKIQL